LLYGLGDNRRALGIWATSSEGESAYYELDADLNFVPKDDAKTADFIQSNLSNPQDAVSIYNSYVKLTDEQIRVWRLPISEYEAFNDMTVNGDLRVCREVATERDLFNCHGTFYELPAENADGFAKIRPVSSHSFKIHDYASYRGMLVMTGIDPVAAKNNPHVIISEDGKAAVWAGVIDDLWKLGKPRGKGGPWKNELVAAGVPSDPYLIGFYDKRKLSLSHDGNEPLTF